MNVGTSWTEIATALAIMGIITYGSLILRAVCENQPRAAYRSLRGSPAAPRCAVARGRGACDDTAGGVRPEGSSASAPERPPARVPRWAAVGPAWDSRRPALPVSFGLRPTAGGRPTPAASAPAARWPTGESTPSRGHPAPDTWGAATWVAPSAGPCRARCDARSARPTPPAPRRAGRRGPWWHTPASPTGALLPPPPPDRRRPPRASPAPPVRRPAGPPSGARAAGAPGPRTPPAAIPGRGSGPRAPRPPPAGRAARSPVVSRVVAR